ncbi:unnamed protein product, partial [Phaeothamnion confervicola]
QPHQHGVLVRLARKGDVAAIRSCNLQTLPENYTPQFYEQHLASWPQLALVAEHAPRQVHCYERERARAHFARFSLVFAPSLISSCCFFHTRFRLVAERSSRANRCRRPPKNKQPGQESEVVGYVLGRIEEGSAPPPPLPQHRAGGAGRAAQLPPPPLGHVTSLAVLPPYRRLGVGRKLMEGLHEQMRTSHGAGTSRLHVRVSNEGALRLYRDVLRYSVVSVIKHYYADSEDAYLMQSDLRQLPSPLQRQQQQQRVQQHSEQEHFAGLGQHRQRGEGDAVRARYHAGRPAAAG